MVSLAKAARNLDKLGKRVTGIEQARGKSINLVILRSL